ncbi:MAG: hypothetical protein WCP52_12945 [Bacteroidota bacterium]
MIENKLLKLTLLIIGIFIQSKVGFCQPKGQAPKATEHNTSEAGFDRTLKKGEEGHSWSWGTLGHGSFDEAIELFKNDEFFKPEKEVMVYKEGVVKYKVFTYAKINYVEVDYGWRSFTYITK